MNTEAAINETFNIIGEAAKGINFPVDCKIDPHTEIIDIRGKYTIVILEN